MSQASSQIEITEKVIDFGSHFVQVSQITSARIRRRAMSNIIVGGLLLVFGVLLTGLALWRLIEWQALGANFSMEILAIIPGLLLSAFGRHMVFGLNSAVIIAASDGSKVVVPATQDQVLAAVLDNVRAATAASGHPYMARIDLAAGTVEHFAAGDDGGEMPILPSDPGAAERDPISMPVGGVPGGQGHEPAGDFAAHPGHGAASNGAYPGVGEAGAGQYPATAGGNRHNGGHYGQAAATPSIDVPRSVPASRPEEHTVGQIDDIIVLMDEAKVPYQDDLENMLIVVRKHLVGDDISREDALNNWQAFAEYARDYLGGVEGLLPLIDRVQSSPFMRVR